MVTCSSAALAAGAPKRPSLNHKEESFSNARALPSRSQDLSLYGQDSWTERRSDLRSALSESRHLSRRSSSIPGELYPPLRHDQHSVSLCNRRSGSLCMESRALGRVITQRRRRDDRTASPKTWSRTQFSPCLEGMTYRQLSWCTPERLRQLSKPSRQKRYLRLTWKYLTRLHAK
jgi:hypothetical protein